MQGHKQQLRVLLVELVTMAARVSSSRCMNCASIKNESELAKNERGRLQCRDTASCAREKAKLAGLRLAGTGQEMKEPGSN